MGKIPKRRVPEFIEMPNYVQSQKNQVLPTEIMWKLF
jgi:hypothetical protein